jgi:phosphatidylglycerophosphate synthase
MAVDWRARARELGTVPNLVTLSRLPLVAGVVLALDSPVRYLLFALIVFSDGVDGWLARRHDKTTDVAAMRDPPVAKRPPLDLYPPRYPRTGLATAYLVLFFARDAFVVALAPLVPLYGFETSKVRARPPGKVVTNLQFLAMVAMLVPAVLATEALLWALGVASTVAVADYVVFVARELSDRDWVHDRRGVVVSFVGTAVVFAAVVAALLAGELAAFLNAVG